MITNEHHFQLFCNSISNISFYTCALPVVVQHNYALTGTPTVFGQSTVLLHGQAVHMLPGMQPCQGCCVSLQGILLVLLGCMVGAAALTSMQQSGAPWPFSGTLHEKFAVLPYVLCSCGQLCSDQLVEFPSAACHYYSLLLERSCRGSGVLLVVLERVLLALSTFKRQGGAKWQVYFHEQHSCSMISAIVRGTPLACC